MDKKELFTQIYTKNVWNITQTESKSGDGSTLSQTVTLRNELEKLIKNFEIHSMFDAPCGDFNWMKEVNFPEEFYYIGGDIVQELIDVNNSKYSTSKRNFIQIDVSDNTNYSIPKVDLILCRDLFVHLCFEDVFKTLANFKASGSKYLLTTTFPNHFTNNRNVYVGFENRLNAWQPLNLEINPFNLKKPLMYLNEGCTEHPEYSDKSLALWDLNNF